MKEITVLEFMQASKAERVKYCLKIIKGQSVLERRKENMPKVNIIETRVRELLECFPNTRENDNLLYVKYLKEYHYIDFNEDTFINYEEKGLPSYKSIERARRKIQNEYLTCQASEKIKTSRDESEKTYRSNYGGNIGGERY